MHYLVRWRQDPIMVWYLRYQGTQPTLASHQVTEAQAWSLLRGPRWRSWLWTEGNRGWSSRWRRLWRRLRSRSVMAEHRQYSQPLHLMP